MSIPLNETEDNSLLAAIQQGNHAAFAVLIRRHHARFYAIAYRFLGNRQDAEDIVQHLFVKLWESPYLWDAGKHTRFTTWFYRVIVNQCIDARRKKTPLPLVDENELQDKRLSQEQLLALRQRRKLLEEAINNLPERQRTALNLCFYEGVSNQEAANVMGVKLKALQSLLMRAKETLKIWIMSQDMGDTI